ncbi:MAG: D-alanyl-D-alanine carboxypeptidase [Deltaproteobacteria bacterium]|jgi:D-alanyl-D-alanine carboxypeptidase/D-alanyl-D-alanine-endopeptidase (penicillin-binding protein 4)|nr:MAG: D-alanyl-D-alanine carboxypeptidase [Deltaproteobacteria bacterium]
MKRAWILFLILLITFSSYAFSQANLYHLIPKEAASNGKLGVVVKSLTQGKSVFEYNSDKLFIPASNIKVITSVTALSLLKPDYRFKTELYSGGEILNGILYGGLFIKGYGDPTLTTQDLSLMVYKLKEMGIKEIRGGITVDDSYFGQDRYGKGWKKQWRGNPFCPPIGALTLNHNKYKVHIRPSKPGKAPVVELEPKGTSVNVINNAVTGGRKSTVLIRRLEEGRTILIKGRIPLKASPAVFEVTVSNPAIYTGSVFKKLIEDSGIKVQGFISTGETPTWANKLYTHLSEPLYTIINQYNKNSINLIGENLFKTLGAEILGPPGTWEKGSKVVSDFLRKAVSVEDEFNIVDGSGLSLLNRVSPQTMIKVLEFAYINKPIFSEFISSLPIGGVDGTLKRRFRMSEVEGRVIAKTGHLNNVNALSGYLITKKGEILVFSILANGLGWKAVEFQNALLTHLVDCCESSI